MVGDPHLKATTAIKQQGVTDEAELRRLQRHWKAIGATLLSQALREDAPAPNKAPATPDVAVLDLPAPQTSLAALTAAVEPSLEPISLRVAEAQPEPEPVRMEEMEPATCSQPRPAPVSGLELMLALNPLGRAFADWQRMTEAAYKTIGRNIDFALQWQRSFGTMWPGR